MADKSQLLSECHYNKEEGEKTENNFEDSICQSGFT